MVVFITNFFAYLFWFLYTYKKEKTLTLYSSVIALITFIAFAGVYTLLTGIYAETFGEVDLNSVDITPFIYTFVGFVFFFRPLKYVKIKTLVIPEFNSKFFSQIVYFWVLLTFAYSLLKIGEAYIATSIGLDVIYEDRHMDGMSLSFMTYTNPILSKIAWIGEIVSRTTSPVMLFYATLNIINGKKKLLSIIIMILSVLPSIANSIAMGSRGAMVWSIFKFLFIVILMKDYLNKRFKKVIVSILIGGLVVVLFYSVTITIARNDGSGALNSILRYFGEPFPNALYSYWEMVSYHPMGTRFFPIWFNNNVVYDMSPGEIHNYWGSLTGVPILNWKILPIDCYIEFGVLGGFLFILFISILFTIFFKLYPISVYTITVLFFYFEMCDSSFTGYNAFDNTIMATVETVVVLNLFFYFFCRNKRAV